MDSSPSPKDKKRNWIWNICTFLTALHSNDTWYAIFAKKREKKQHFTRCLTILGHFASKFTAIYYYICTFYVHARSYRYACPICFLAYSEKSISIYSNIRSYTYIHIYEKTIETNFFCGVIVCCIAKYYRRQPYSTGV